MIRSSPLEVVAVGASSRHALPLVAGGLEGVEMSTANEEQDGTESDDAEKSWEGFATHLASLVFRWRSLQRASFHSRMSSEVWMSRDGGAAPKSVRDARSGAGPRF